MNREETKEAIRVMTNIEKRFWAFHLSNPIVYRLFSKFTKEAAQVTNHYSAKAVYERIRWSLDFETTETTINPDTNKPLKLNNDFTAHYARLFMQRNPELDGFFRTREQKG